MREFTKSVASASLAGALFSGRQLTNLLSKPPRSGESDEATDAFNALALAAADQAGGVLREAYHALDKLQRQGIDTSFRFLRLDAFGANGTAGSISTFAQETTQQFRKWVGGCNCGVEECDGSCKQDRKQSRRSDEGDPWRSQESKSNRRRRR